MRLRKVAVAAGLAIAFCAPAGAETITDGNASFDLSQFRHNFCNAKLETTGPNHLCQLTWHYRLDDDPEESLLDGQDASSSEDDTASFVWGNLDGSDLGAELLFELQGSSTDGAAVLVQTLAITNFGANERTMDIFAYADTDLGGASNDDVGTLIAANDTIAQDDADGTHSSQHLASGADAYAVTDIRASNTLRRQLVTDGAATQLDNSGLPFGLGDMEFAFQWAGRAIGPGETLEFRLQSNFDWSSDLAIEKIVSSPAVYVFDNFVYTLTVTNNGLSPATDVEITDALPVGLNLRNSSLSAAGDCSESLGTVSCSLSEPLAAGDSATARLVVRSKTTHDGNLLNNCAEAFSSTDSNPGNNSSCVDVLIEPIPTTLEAQPAVFQARQGLDLHRYRLEATLTHRERGRGVKKEVLEFRDNSGELLCTETTDSNGVAVCGALFKSSTVTEGGGYTVSFAGSKNYDPSDDSAGLVTVLQSDF